MEILIISGFLGAGKTTFIQNMASALGRQFVILENEFSDIGIDGDLLKKSKAEIAPAALDITEISNGCICCSSNVDFGSTVVTISNTIDPDYLVVEPSGVAFPTNILNSLEKVLYERIGVLDPITIIDGEHYNSAKSNFSEYFNDQIDNAKHIVVSKSENFSESDFLNIKEDLDIDDTTDFPLKHYSKFTTEEWNNLFTKSGKKALKKELEIDSRMENIAFSPFKPLNLDELIYILEELNTGKYGYIYRSKGFFENKGFWYRFDYVDSQYIIGESEEMETGKAVVIGIGLDKKALKKLLSKKRATIKL